jgi:glycosyltransferase involved in cell wall biosynthesis
MKAGKTIFILVTNDLVYDQRVLRHADYLQKNKHKIFLVGRRKLNTNKEITLNFPHKRFEMIFSRSWMFYAEYNIRLTLFLLFKKIDILWANDLDTLPSAYVISKLRSKKLVYDSHEFFTGVPELENKPIVKWFWRKIESTLLPRIKIKFTVSEGIASLYKEHYDVDFDVVRNLSSSFDNCNQTEHELPIIQGFSFSEPFFIYQGALNKDRGLEYLIESMHFVDGYKLLIVGDGDIKSELQDLVFKKQLIDKVKFGGLIEPTILKRITPKAKIGFSVELPSNDNYRYCLPNKLFDYLQAGIPTIAYENLEIKKLFNQFKIGLLLNNHDSRELAERILYLINTPSLMTEINGQISLAQVEFSWKNESKKIGDIISKIESK